ncbi:helix-turn-helix domain-containing protein [Parabacteroides pacaensis]|uniref:helix-turn-helix domain-containing protein n=1 Tax=Parabacteroides pacaensis TaxID=2086575 RepID=UPI000D10544A|nr:helix-turn-helix domain-containing protein [Parabacteroides pacaensis]
MALKVVFIYVIDFMIFIIVLCSFYLGYQRQVDFFQQSIHKMFDKVLKEDLQIRLNKSGLKYYAYSKSNVTHPFLNKGIELGSAKGALIPYDNELKKDISDKGVDRVLQYALVNKCPITFEGIDSLFSKELEAKGVKTKAYIYIYLNGINISPTREEIVKKFCVSTDLRCMDIKKIVKVQAFVEYSMWNMIGKMPKSYLIGGNIALLLSLLSLIWMNKMILKDKKDREEAKSLEWKKAGENKFKFGKVIVNQELAKVINKELECEVLLPPQPMSALCMFLDTPDHYVKVEDIIKELWPDSDKTEEQLIRNTTKLLSSLKSRLKDVIKIEFEKRGQGYLLITERRPLKVIEWKEDGESLIGAFRFNVSKKHLRIRGLEIPLTSWQVQIIEMFLKTSNHSIKKDKLCTIFKQEAENNKIDVEELVTEKMLCITKLFVRDPDVEIIKDANSNYQLVIKK